jgi:hypothetical protein
MEIGQGLRNGVVDRNKFASLRGLHNFAFVIEEAAETPERAQLTGIATPCVAQFQLCMLAIHAAGQNEDLRFGQQLAPAAVPRNCLSRRRNLLGLNFGTQSRFFWQRRLAHLTLIFAQDLEILFQIISGFFCSVPSFCDSSFYLFEGCNIA